MYRPPFITNEIYHIYNRGVEKRDICMDDHDRYRFIHDLFEFNDTSSAINNGYYFKIQGSHKDVNKPIKNEARDFLVDILAFCIMPNHYHLLLRQKADGGITNFMRKFGTGYTNSFNKKHERVGPLFQGKFKAKHVKEDAYLYYLPHYIHLNPLDMYMPEWREKGIADHKKALEYLASYRWSSYLDYIGKKNIPSVTQREVIMKLFNGTTGYKKKMDEWMRHLTSKDISLFHY